ncbi:hypothetical protein R83H12_00703 [Fibrobacteria bacterium R8-3-H12]
MEGFFIFVWFCIVAVVVLLTSNAGCAVVLAILTICLIMEILTLELWKILLIIIGAFVALFLATLLIPWIKKKL